MPVQDSQKNLKSSTTKPLGKAPPMPSAYLGTDGEHSFPACAQDLNFRMVKISVSRSIYQIYFPCTICSMEKSEFPILNPKILLCVSNVPIQ